MKTSRMGFTLIELMIVVVVIGILAAIAIPKFGRVARSAKEAEAGPVLKQLYTLQERYYQKTGEFATDVSYLEGGAGNYSGKYYDYALTADPAAGTYVACGTPRDPSLGLRSLRIDQAGTVAEGAC